LCADADALHEHLGFREVVVLSHSYGGFIALEYALRYPERLSRLILSGTTLALDYEDEIAANARSKGAAPEQLEALGAEVTDEPAWRQRLTVIGPLYWHDFDADLHARLFGEMVLNVETQEAGWAFGRVGRNPPFGRDPRTDAHPCRSGRLHHPPLQAQIIPDSELLVFDESGHWPYFEEPEAYLGAVRRCLGQRRSRRVPENGRGVETDHS
jgi:proline iminopeptidase